MNYHGGRDDCLSLTCGHSLHLRSLSSRPLPSRASPGLWEWGMGKRNRTKITISVLLILVVSLCVFPPRSLAQVEVPKEAPLRPVPARHPSVHTGFIPPPLDLSHLTGRRKPKAALSLPSRWDWREMGGVTPVKDQGNCGSCYAFAAIGNLEAKVLIDGGGLFDFSENNAKECEWYHSSCGGGNYFRMANWFSQRGTVLESCDPYVPTDVPCNESCSYVKTLLDWRIISGDAVPSPDVLKSYLQLYGPIYTSMYAGSGDAWGAELSNYDGSYTLYYSGNEDTNHAVLIVGWDDSLTHAGGTGAWIVKNSWGTGAEHVVMARRRAISPSPMVRRTSANGPPSRTRGRTMTPKAICCIMTRVAGCPPGVTVPQLDGGCVVIFPRTTPMSREWSFGPQTLPRTWTYTSTMILMRARNR